MRGRPREYGRSMSAPPVGLLDARCGRMQETVGRRSHTSIPRGEQYRVTRARDLKCEIGPVAGGMHGAFGHR
jgi:hypothetical protein